MKTKSRTRTTADANARVAAARMAAGLMDALKRKGLPTDTSTSAGRLAAILARVAVESR